MPDPHYLYTYVPKDNTVSEDGLLSTALAPSGWEKYKERTGADTKKDVLEVLDSWDPGFRRSYGVSMLNTPVDETADKRMQDFAADKKLYKIDAAKLLAAGIITQMRSINTGRRGTHAVSRPDYRKIDWSRKKPGRFLFSNVPHYIVETKDGYIPPEYVEEVR